MKRTVSLILLIAVWAGVAAGSLKYSEEMVKSHGREWSAGKSWDYVSGLVAKTILSYCDQYPDDALAGDAYSWCKTYADNAIGADGKFYNFKKGSLDNIASGKVLFNLYAHEKAANPAGAERYRKAADYLYEYLRHDYKRISLAEGKDCFIHKDSYPYQMWLDGLYMGAAFYAEYLAAFAPADDAGWADIALQFRTIHAHTYDAGKSLCYHGWSAKPSDSNSFWANKSEPFLGCSKEFWGRGMGWYAAALVDVLEMMPREHADYASIAEIFAEVAEGIRRWQDPESGVWYQLLQYDDSYVSARGNRNYLEASASCMFTYALLKGMRLGLLEEPEYGPTAEKAYAGLLSEFITDGANGIDINRICRSAGLGPANKPERNGTADYYLDGSDVYIVSNEGKGIGSFIMASLEYEKYSGAGVGMAEDASHGSVRLFDLSGRKLQSAPRGLYIEMRDNHAAKKVGTHGACVR